MRVILLALTAVFVSMSPAWADPTGEWLVAGGSARIKIDDCGEPGTSDTFGIKTDTYENGPNKLIGGNIQIH